MYGLFSRQQREQFIKIDGHARDYTGFFIGFRTWWLEAKKNGAVIHRIDESEKDNYTKYLKFLIGLRNKGYDVRDVDMEFYKSEPFIVKRFESFVTRNDLIQAASLCNYDEGYLMSLKNKSEDEKELFAWHMGLTMNELYKIMTKFS